jgi:hypothetical protein
MTENDRELHINISPLKSLKTHWPKKYSIIHKSLLSQELEYQRTAGFRLSEGRAGFTQMGLYLSRNPILLKNSSPTKCSKKVLRTSGNGSTASTTCPPYQSPIKTISKSINWPKTLPEWGKKSF